MGKHENWVGKMSGGQPSLRGEMSLLGLTAKKSHITAWYVTKGGRRKIALTEGAYDSANHLYVMIKTGETSRISLDVSRYCAVTVLDDGSWELRLCKEPPELGGHLRYYYSLRSIGIWAAIDPEIPLPPGTEE